MPVENAAEAEERSQSPLKSKATKATLKATKKAAGKAANNYDFAEQ